MKRVITLAILIATILVSCTPQLQIKSINSDQACNEKGGYWYNDKCWKDYEDEGISEADIDSTVDAQMKIISKSVIHIDHKTYPLVSFFPFEELGRIMFVAVYKESDTSFKSLLIVTNKKMKDNPITGTFKTPVVLFDGNMMGGEIDDKTALEGAAKIEVLNFDNLEFDIKGRLVNANKDTIAFDLISNEAILGAGTSKLEIKGDEAYLSGDLGTISYIQIKNLIKNHPEVKTIVMTKISGSLNDAVNMHTGRILREHGFTTKVLSTSDIASGGVDLFCAGKKRIVEKGAKIGIHSWCCVNDVTARKIPKDHPAHRYQIEYFTMALGADLGPAFYFHTLKSAKFNGIHYMSDKEIKKWNIATDFIE
jgi:hypothetical protein